MLTTLGDWPSPNMRRQGVTWNVGADGAGVSKVTAACGGGPQAVVDHVGFVPGGEGVTTLGESCKVTLGLAGAGRWFGQRDGGARVP